MNESIYAALTGVAAYREAAHLPAVEALRTLLGELEGDSREAEALIGHYVEVFSTLTGEGYESMAGYLFDHLRFDESAYGEAAARHTTSPMLEAAARRDIEVFQTVGALECAMLKQQLVAAVPESWRSTVEGLPQWKSGVEFDFDSLTQFYRVNGCGPLARYQAFVWQEGKLHAVPHPDFRTGAEMWGYERQRNQVLENTRALVSGRYVNNALLYGVSGTGKSATVKSMLGREEFAGLRLIEVSKEELPDIPQLVRMLGGRPQKFIIFIDDLAFDREDRTYSVLKSILEGGLEPRPDNVAVYATSNRRNLVRQNFSDRNGDEIDANETIAEKTSLAERFGLRVLFSELMKPDFLRMCTDLAVQAGIGMPPDQLQAEAVKWDVRHPSRSPRSANQFVASLLARQA